MSFYYEYKGCCGKEKVENVREDHEKDCFCGKFLKKFFGQDVEIFTRDGDSVEGRILCIDKEAGIVTVAGTDTGGTADLVADYICCKEIVRVRPL